MRLTVITNGPVCPQAAGVGPAEDGTAGTGITEAGFVDEELA